MVGYVRHFFGCEGKKRLQQSKENGFYGKDPNSMYYIGFTKKNCFLFFSDCSRHFLDASENGDAIKRDVIDKNSSILWYVKKQLFFNFLYYTYEILKAT